MKKALYSTTFLATAGLLALANAGDANAQAAAPAAEKLKISVGGFMSQWVGWVDRERDQSESPASTEKAIDQKSDSEIYFTGSVNLDNGMTASVVVQLEVDYSTSASTSSNGVPNTVSMIDESYLRMVSPSLGELRLGNMDPATQGISVSGPWVGLNPYNQDTTVWLNRPAASTAAVATGMGSTAGGGDQNRINYFTPTIAGFRGALGYTPSTSANTEDQPNNLEGDDIQVGLQWAGKVMNNYGVRAYGAYWKTSGSLAGDQTTTTGGTNSWSIGADVNFADITIGAGYMERNNRRGAVTNDDDLAVWNLGVKYAPGPFSVGLLYMSAAAGATVADIDDDTAQRLQFGVTYLIGPGVNLVGNVLWHDYSDETPSLVGATANSPSSYAVIGGIQVDF